MLGEILGPDLLIVVGLVVLLFGGSRLPGLAHSLGRAKSEFHKGLAEDDRPEATTEETSAIEKSPRNEPIADAEPAARTLGAGMRQLRSMRETMHTELNSALKLHDDQPGAAEPSVRPTVEPTAGYTPESGSSFI